jgi:hypothetical protein
MDHETAIEKSLAAKIKLWTLTAAQRKKYLHAIIKGSDGYCAGSHLCAAGTGQYFTYSGPAGWGTPNGIGAF